MPNNLFLYFIAFPFLILVTFYAYNPKVKDKKHNIKEFKKIDGPPWIASSFSWMEKKIIALIGFSRKGNLKLHLLQKFVIFQKVSIFRRIWRSFRGFGLLFADSGFFSRIQASFRNIAVNFLQGTFTIF